MVSFFRSRVGSIRTFAMVFVCMPSAVGTNSPTGVAQCGNPCHAGSGLAAGSIQCTPCSAGTFNDGTQTYCASCPPGVGSAATLAGSAVLGTVAARLVVEPASVFSMHGW